MNDTMYRKISMKELPNVLNKKYFIIREYTHGQEKEIAMIDKNGQWSVSNVIYWLEELPHPSTLTDKETNDCIQKLYLFSKSEETTIANRKGIMEIAKKLFSSPPSADIKKDFEQRLEKYINDYKSAHRKEAIEEEQLIQWIVKKKPYYQNGKYYRINPKEYPTAKPYTFEELINLFQQGKQLKPLT